MPTVKTAAAVLATAALAAGGCKRSSDEAPPPPPPQMQMPPGGGAMPPLAATGPAREIPMLEGLVQQDPKNRTAWVKLGNDYFDAHQPQKAIAAYDKALELKGDDADVLTDQGVMYRDVGQYDKALQNFEKAHKVDPSHMTSLFNQGVVWAYDKKDAKKAREVWTQVAKLDPNGPNGTKAREAMAELDKTAPAGMPPTK
jgi:cytochrome c-type biogenesis protein CcmH/NrfG